MACQARTESGKRRMTPTKIFRKTNAAYEIAKIVAIMFWLPILGMILAAIYINW